jgi:hypothetical protein
MDHGYIDANALAKRYVMGQLPPHERERFEEHFVECEACQQQIEFSRGLREGFRALADTRGKPIPTPPARNYLHPLIWMAAGLLIASVPAVWFGTRSLQLQQQLDAARHDLASRPPGQFAFVGAGEARGLPTYELNAMRAGSAQPPAVILTAPEKEQIVLLELDNPIAQEFTDYRVAIVDGKGTTVVSGAGIRQTAPDHLVVAVSSESIPPGEYGVTVWGRTANGHYVRVGDYGFRTVLR